MYPSMMESKSSKRAAVKAPVGKSKKPSTPSSKHNVDSSGLEPPPIDMNDETSANSVRESSLRLLLEDLAVKWT